MKKALLLLLLSGWSLLAADPPKESAGAKSPLALERFTLKDGRTYDGIWDAPNSRIHIIQKTNHVGNLSVAPDELLDRKPLGDGSAVKILPDLEITEKVFVLNKQNYQAAQQRLHTAKDKRAALHQFYHGKTLPRKDYDAVMVQYQAADAAIASAERALSIANANLDKALAAYKKAGGKPLLLP